MYYIYKDERLIGSSNSIEYVIEFIKLMIDKEISTEKDSSKLKQLYEDRIIATRPNAWLHELKPILERLGYELTIEVGDSTI